jgi:DNA-binding XRE family transcriptional regulator
MNGRIDFQIIHEAGKPKFAVLPIEQFQQLLAFADMEPTIPNTVVQRIFDDKISPVRAWREHLGLTQKDIADRLGITQAAFAQQEKPDAKLRPKTLKAIATAMGLVTEQLDI